MQLPQGSTMRVARLPNAPLLSLTSGERRALLARPHPLLPGHVGLVDQNGTYHMVKLGEGGSRASVAAVYELQLFTEGGFTQLPLCKEWRDFAHLPDDGLVLCHRGSGRILFAQLPLCEGEHGAVFLFGSHDGPVLSLATNRQLLLSGGADGCVRLWSLDSGAMIDCCRRAADGAAAGQVTAVAFVGPLMVAAGTDHGVVCLYDISTSRLEAVQRFRAGDGPISALAGRLTRRQAHDVVTAAGPRGLDGGGVVEGPVGLPWRSAAAGAVGDGGTETLLAVASPAGWLHVFRAAGSGEDAWQLVHEGALAGEPFLSCSPDGNYLAVGSGAEGDRVVHEQLVSPLAPLAGAGFLPGSAGGSTLVALPAGGTLAGGIRMRLFAAPAAQEPLMLQLTVPLLEPGNEGQRYAEAARDDDFLTWLHRSATATHSTGTATAAATAPGAGSAAPVAAAARLLKGLTLSGSPPGDRGGLAAASPAAPRNPAWGWQAFAPTTSPSQSPRADVQAGDGTGGVQADRSPSAEPWASPPAWASGARAGAAAAAAPGSAGQARQPGAARSPLGSAGRGRSALASSPRGARTGSGGKEFGGVTRGSEAGPGGGGAGGGEAAAAAHEWKAYRPATQPAPRSWITGLPPRSGEWGADPAAAGSCLAARVCDFLPQSVPPSPQQLQQQAQASSAQRGSPAQTRPGAAATPTSPAVSRLVAAAAEARTAGGQLRLASGSSPVITAAGEAFTPGDDGEEVLDDGALESEPEMPCSGTLLPASGIPAAAAASASSGRYATTTTATTATGGLFDDADDDDGAAVVGGPAWAAESQKGSRYPEPRGARGADTQRPAPGAAAAAAVGSGYPDTAGAEAFAAPDGRVWAEGREYSFTQGGWGPEGGRGGGGGGGGLSGYGQSGGEMAAAEASWREGDLDMAPSGFRPPTSTSAAAAPSNGPTRGGALGTSFRFQLPQQHQQQPPLRWEGSQASAGPPQPGSMPLHGHEAEGDAVAQVEYAPDGWVADDEDPLGRTAYFGDALSAAIQGGLDASAGGWPMDDILDKLEELPRQGLGAQHPEANGRQAATAARGLSGAAAAWDKASGLAQRDGEEELGAQKRGGEEQEEEESPEPRGAADLPAPQPEWSGQHLARQRQRGPGPGSDGQGSADEEEPEAVSPIPAAVRRNLALGGFPVAAAAQPEADGIAAAAAARSGPPGTEEEEAWGGWTNVDVLRGPVANGGGGAAAAAAAQRGAPRDIQASIAASTATESSL
ncbi:hypothetical protein PLESTB_001059600 [Pleodorina starrii]|uniref:Uncharacterized protein n=1 Tax=Pleodorina starrii TaxID=330485 RepID=A0A9W6F4M6_9CHLO|nr:hypothetical protein PLESTB_001059600 [Pleodorina starrii]